MHLSGSFQGATVTLELGISGSSFVALSDGVFTGPNADYVLEAPRNALFRAVVTGAGSPSPSIPTKLLPVPEEGVVFREAVMRRRVIEGNLLSSHDTLPLPIYLTLLRKYAWMEV